MNRIMIAFDPPAMDYVFRLLAARPWGEVAPLVADIQAQVASQQGQPLAGRQEAGRQEANRANGGLPMPQLGPDQPRSPGLTD